MSPCALCGHAPLPAAFTVGEFVVDPANRMLTRYGQRAQLTQKDFELAAFLLRHSGSLVSREQIYAKVWPGREGRITRTLDTHIARIRDKLRLRPEQGWELTSVYGHGYRLARVANRGRIAA